ncbi:uncharacterized protein LOC144437646 isoform X2 [Glandiceps talaboti]
MENARLLMSILLLHCVVAMVTGCARFDASINDVRAKRFSNIASGLKPVDNINLQTGKDAGDTPKILSTNEKDGTIRYKRQTEHTSSHQYFDSHVKIFQNTDTNKDGFITRDEYKENNPNMTDEDTRIVMEVYDKDGDNRVSEVEFLREGNIDSHAVGCDVIALNQCGIQFINTVRLANNDDDAICLGLQTYVDCISRQLIPTVCESQSFTSAVMKIVSSFQADDICPEIDVNALLTPTEHQNRKRRHAQVQGMTQNENATDRKCGLSSIINCDTDFIHELRKDEAPCNSLLGYRRCIHRSTQMCDDVTAYRLRDGIKHVTRSYRQIGLCQKEPTTV